MQQTMRQLQLASLFVFETMQCIINIRWNRLNQIIFHSPTDLMIRSLSCSSSSSSDTVYFFPMQLSRFALAATVQQQQTTFLPNPGQGANFEVAQIDRRFTRFHSEMNKQVRTQVGVVLLLTLSQLQSWKLVNSIVILLFVFCFVCWFVYYYYQTTLVVQDVVQVCVVNERRYLAANVVQFFTFSQTCPAQFFFRYFSPFFLFFF